MSPRLLSPACVSRNPPQLFEGMRLAEPHCPSRDPLLIASWQRPHLPVHCVVRCDLLQNCHPGRFQGERAGAALLAVEPEEKFLLSSCVA